MLKLITIALLGCTVEGTKLRTLAEMTTTTSTTRQNILDQDLANLAAA